MLPVRSGRADVVEAHADHVSPQIHRREEVVSKANGANRQPPAHVSLTTVADDGRLAGCLILILILIFGCVWGGEMISLNGSSRHRPTPWGWNRCLGWNICLRRGGG